MPDERRFGIHILTENLDYNKGREFHVLQGLFPRPQGSRQWLVRFENGYEASVITGPHAYCDFDNPYELGLAHVGGPMCAAPEFMEGDQVVGYLNDQTLESLLDQIAQLPPSSNCTHRRPS